MTAPVDYNAVLADLEARRAQIDGAIAVIRSLLGGGVLESAFVPPSGNGTPLGDSPTAAQQGAPPKGVHGIQSDSFFGLSTAAAVRKFLSLVKRPQAPRAIADALQEGGQVHATDAKTAYTNVYTALKRGSPNDFVQTRNGEWGLAEWYSNKPKSEGE